MKKDSISKVRNYYREEARRTNKKEIPWWLTADDVAPAKMRLWSGYPEENRRLEAKMFVLFASGVVVLLLILVL